MTASANAAPITLPTDLVPLDQYRLVFITAGSQGASNANASFYNNLVADEAAGVTELNALGTTWTAIVSTVNDGAATANTNTDPSPVGNTGVPIYVVGSTDSALNPVRIADHYDDLWDGSIQSAINRTSTGALKLQDVWTGTSIGGASSAALGSSNPRHGDSAFTNTNWVNNGTAAQANAKSFYAISGVLTVVPEPNSLHLSACVLAIACAFRWRRRSFRIANNLHR